MEQGPLFDLTDTGLEAALVDLGGALAPMTAPDLARTVRLRVESMGVPSSVQPGWLALVRPDRAPGLPTGRPLRGLILAIAGLLILAGIAAALVSAAGPAHRRARSRPDGRAPAAVERPIVGQRDEPTAIGLQPRRRTEPVDVAARVARSGRPGGADGPRSMLPPATVLVPASRSSAAARAAFVRGRRLAPGRAGLRPDRDDPGGTGRSDADGTPVAIIVMQYPGTTDAPSRSSNRTTVSGSRSPGTGFGSLAGRTSSGVRPDGEVDADAVRLVGNVLA
jgi:hypothetical protein